jgi:general secretion pathway protein K
VTGAVEQGMLKSSGNGVRASALLVVLLMLGMIAALAAVVSRSVSGAAMEVGAARMNAQSETDLRAGIELGVAAIFKLGEDMRSADTVADLTDRRIAVRITNERGRIDLNLASAPLLTALFEASGMMNGDSAALAAGVIEWRGGSASQKLAAPEGENSPASKFSGFSSFDMQPGSELREAPGQIVGTRYFFHPVQLVSVPGASKSLVQQILPLITVANGSKQIDPFIASPRLVASLPNVSPDRVEAFLNARDGDTGREIAIQLLGVPQDMVTSEAAPGWRLQITSTMRTGRVYRGEAVIAILKGDTEPYRVLYVDEDQVQPPRAGR